MTDTLDGVHRKVARRLLPPLFVMFLLSFLDRTNIGLVKQSLQVDAGISAAAFGLGAGIFFVGYAFAGIPSNLVLHRVGARRWLAATMLAGAIPLVSGLGNLGGFVGPYVMGLAESATREPAAGLYVVAVLVALGVVAALGFRWVGGRTRARPGGRIAG